MNLSLSLNAEFIDSQYRKWKEDPRSLGREWQAFFEGFELSSTVARADAGFREKGELLKQSYVHELIYRYRDLGHLLSCLDPLAMCPTSHPLLDLSAFALSEGDLARRFFAPRTLFPEGEASLREILSALRETYCHSVGVEYMHLQDPAERLWLQEHIEPARNRALFAGEEKKRILNKLCQANLFEQFIQLRYVGQKRFSVEGAEVIVPMLDALVQHAFRAGCREVLLGVAHRGRLNIQVNVLGKPYEWIFCEFEDHYDPDSIYGAGDVKYHRGFMADLPMENSTIRLFLANNPSHLEAVDPVLEGIAYARQQQAGADGRRLVLPVLIHGDAAFAGQGVVAETLNLSQLEGYHTGGTLHIIVNNQIGFTTLPEHARSTRYATDVAKMLMVPIFHVHGEDPEAVVHVVKLAFDYRAHFNKDVVLDVVCYRRYGHNEGDEPYYTQPLMYERIKDRPPLHVIYSRSLREAGVIEEGELERITGGIEQCLESAYKAAHDRTCGMPEDRFYETWEGIDGGYSHEPVKTAVEESVLLDISRKLTAFPDGFTVHPRLARILKKRLETVEAGAGIDWATAEALAFGTLLLEGTPVRLSGQDCGRGTFSQRHSVLSDLATGEHFVPLNHLAPGPAAFTVFDSMLSENAVLGFEYGVSLVSPGNLVIWEAQFGDFANNAQALFDQFISSAQYKWQRLSGLVVLLPHGFEGQGPEHSSARIERFLQLCAQENMEVCYPSTPAQYFHLLRRQLRRGFRKPLIVFTPKSLLRHPSAVSAIAELTSGRFEEVLSHDPGFENASRLLLCSGRVYYELLAKREKTADSDTAIVRVEQFYPTPEVRLREAISGFPSADRFFWVQEEPRNMGAWEFMRPRLRDIIGVEPGYIGRPEAASPASGYPSLHRQEQETFLGMAFPGQETSQEKS